MMTGSSDFITVFRSAEPDAKADAECAQQRLAQAGIRSIVVGDETPGVVEGTYEVRVAASDQAKAEAILAVPAPEPEDEEEVPEAGLSRDLDFVPIFSSQAMGAEVEAISLQTILESAGIPTILVGSSQFPSLPFEVRVPKSRLEEAITLVEAAQSGAAVEGESE
jgi:hypothetical protein